LLTRDANGDLVGSTCSVVDPGVLVAAGGEPRGGVIKVVIGLGILAVVLLWAFRRQRRGSRPYLPGAPEP
jgi:MYXO-CTERM domain-containing protein